MFYVIGVDPGLYGGVTLLSWTDESVNVDTFVMPTKDSTCMKKKKLIDLVKLRQRLDAFAVPAALCSLVMIERQSVRAKEGARNSMTAGILFGELICFFELTCVEPKLPTPQKWKGVVLDGTLKDKPAAVAYCAKNFPQINLLPSKRHRKPHDGMADSVCIATYARMTLEASHAGVSQSEDVHLPAAGDPGRGTAHADGRKGRRRRRPAAAAPEPDVVPVQGDIEADQQ
jgi:hypothetical protein